MTLEELKQYLRIDFDDDDDLLNELIVASEAYIDKTVGTGYKSDDSLKEIAKMVQKKLINEMYRNRSTGAIDKVQDRMVTTMLDVLSNADGGEENV